MARPEFKPTSAQRKKVAIAAGGGMSHSDIATALGIARGTLLKHFEEELSIGAQKKRMEVLDAMHKCAKGGNVSAQRAYLAMTAQSAAPPVEKPKGKKEQAKEDAKTADKGTDWEDLLTPNVVPIKR